MAARRSPAADERKRDPERTRERILEAALVEFGEHGYAGARTSAIAQRAGVNQQLISYYFDGKAGLFRALTERWRELSGRLTADDLPLAEVIDNFVRTSVEQRHWTRLLVWEALTGSGDSGSGGDSSGGDSSGGEISGGDSSGGENDEEHGAYFVAMVDELRRRQAAGELAADLDPAYLQLVLFAAAAAPVLLPQVAHRLTGRSPESPEFLDAYRAELRRIVHHLS